MGWKHVVIEGYCLYKDTDLGAPKCCLNGTNNIGLHCLGYDEKEHKYCPFFAYGTARTSVVLTGADGDEVAYSSFSSDENLSNEKKWLEEEQKWIEHWKKHMLK